MGQTIGSQFFGPWYDVIGWIVGAAVFLYFAIAVEQMSPLQKEKLPAFLLNKKDMFQPDHSPGLTRHRQGAEVVVSHCT